MSKNKKKDVKVKYNKKKLIFTKMKNYHMKQMETGMMIKYWIKFAI